MWAGGPGLFSGTRAVSPEACGAGAARPAVTTAPVCLARFNDEVKHIKVVEKDSWVHITEAKKFESLLVRAWSWGAPTGPSPKVGVGPRSPTEATPGRSPASVLQARLPVGRAQQVSPTAGLGAALLWWGRGVLPV